MAEAVHHSLRALAYARDMPSKVHAAEDMAVSAMLRARLQEMYDAGPSYRDLGRVVGVSHVTVKKFLDGSPVPAEIRSFFRKRDFKDSDDALRKAARAFAEEHPEALGNFVDDPLPNRRTLRALSEFKRLPSDVRETIERDSRDGDLPFWTWCAEVERLLRLRAVEGIGKAFEGPDWRSPSTRRPGKGAPSRRRKVG
jgi:hypothetical protein